MSSAMLAQPLRSSRISSIRCWKMSWLILRSNGRRVKQYRPTGVLNVVRSWHSSAIGTLKYPAFASSVLKIFAPWNLGFISSRVGILCGHLLMALFRCLGSRHIRMLPSFFVLYTMLEHGIVVYGIVVYGIVVLLGNCSFPCCHHKVIHWYNKLDICGITWGAFIARSWFHGKVYFAIYTFRQVQTCKAGCNTIFE